MTTDIAVIVGAGSGLSASLARLFSRDGMRVALAARHPEKLADLCAETKARAYACDATDPEQVARLHAQVAARSGRPDTGGVQRRVATARRHRDARAGSRAGSHPGQLLRRVPGRTGCRQAHAEGGPRHDSLYRRHGGRKGIRSVRAVRHGQVWFARTGAEYGARARAEKYSCCPRCSRWRHRADARHECIGSCLGSVSRSRTLSHRPILHLHRQQRSAWTWEIEVRPWTENF